MQHSPGFLALVADAKTRIRECSIDTVREWLETGRAFFLIDVREDREVRNGIVRGARHLGRGVLERDVEQTLPDRDAEIVLYCGGGFRSALAADNLQKMGYRNVTSMEGGFRAWVAAGLPVERPESS